MCRVLEVSTSGYYAWRRRPSSRRAQENAILSGRIAEIHEQSQGIYGSRRVHAELRAQGVVISWQRVARLMRASGLQGVTRRRRVSTTQSDRQAMVAPDRVERCFEASEPNRLWVADITYVPTVEGFLYLATVLDVFSRKGGGLGHERAPDGRTRAGGTADGDRHAGTAQGRVPFRPRQTSTRRWRSPRAATKPPSCVRWAR